jgi:hypothetical protein
MQLALHSFFTIPTQAEACGYKIYNDPFVIWTNFLTQSRRKHEVLKVTNSLQDM